MNLTLSPGHPEPLGLQTRKNQSFEDFLMAVGGFSRFASVQPDKKNSMGARHLRQIELGYFLPPQVRHGVAAVDDRLPASPVR